MCLIAVKPKGVALPKPEQLREGERSNKDGIGIAYWKANTNEVHIKKNFLDIEELLSWIPANIMLDDALVIHFRFATSGLKDEGNRHPFPITRNKELLREVELVCQQAVAHNGVITSYSGHDKYSDTQKFIVDILADDKIKNNLDSEAVRKLLASFLDGDRLAILNSNGSLYILGEWIKEGDIYYSNSGFRVYVTPITDYSSGGYYAKGLYSDSYDSCWKNKNDTKSLISPSGLVTKETNYKVVPASGNGFHGICDGCGYRKHVHKVLVEETEYELCKVCRKAVRKGTLGLGDEYEDDVKTKETALVACYSCLEWVNEIDTITFQGQKYCSGCLERIPGMGQDFRFE